MNQRLVSVEGIERGRDTEVGTEASQDQGSSQPGYGEKPKVPFRYGLRNWVEGTVTLRNSRTRY